MTPTGTLLGELLRLSAALQACSAAAKAVGDAELVAFLRDAGWKTVSAIARASRAPVAEKEVLS